jgi:hypothetical protein
MQVMRQKRVCLNLPETDTATVEESVGCQSATECLEDGTRSGVADEKDAAAGEALQCAKRFVGGKSAHVGGKRALSHRAVLRQCDGIELFACRVT